MAKVIHYYFLAMAFLMPSPLIAEDFEIFDGRVYNGKFYPRIDVIEWGEPSHMEFHIFSKGKPVDLSFELETKTGRKVMLVNYYMVDRNEHLCRRVLAPGHFGQSFYVYRDNSDAEFDNVIVSAEKLPEKKGQSLVNPKKYLSCGEESPSPSRSTAGTPSESQSTSSATSQPAPSEEGSISFKNL